MLRAPSLTAISVLTVALGVGAGTSLFSVVKAVLLNPLPYPEPRAIGLDRRGERSWQADAGGLPAISWTGARRTTAFTAIAAYGATYGNDTGCREWRRLTAKHTRRCHKPGFLLGDGRAGAGSAGHFPPPSTSRARAPVAVIGYGLWQRAFGGNLSAIGRTVRVADVAPTIVGIMPPGFAWPEKVEIWMPSTVVRRPGDTIIAPGTTGA